LDSQARTLAVSVVARFESAVDAAQVPPVFALILLTKVFRIILKNYYKIKKTFDDKNQLQNAKKKLYFQKSNKTHFFNFQIGMLLQNNAIDVESGVGQTGVPADALVCGGRVPLRVFIFFLQFLLIFLI
jgi:hypothetical protein